MNSGVPTSTRDLQATERRFLAAMQRLGYGRFEQLQIQDGELALEPWPTTIRSVKFVRQSTALSGDVPCEFSLKEQVVQFFKQIRGIKSGVIRVLEIRGGLPFLMDVEERTGTEPLT